jgi:hypothetical protein
VSAGAHRRAALDGQAHWHDNVFSTLCILTGCVSARSGERLTGVPGRFALPRSPDAWEG